MTLGKDQNIKRHTRVDSAKAKRRKEKGERRKEKGERRKENHGDEVTKEVVHLIGANYAFGCKRERTDL